MRWRSPPWLGDQRKCKAIKADLSNEVDAADRLFKSCIYLYWTLLRRALVSKLEVKKREALRDEFGIFYFCGESFYSFEGRLDNVLVNSSRLRDRVLSVLVEVGEILCNEKTAETLDLEDLVGDCGSYTSFLGLFAVIGTRVGDVNLSSQRQELQILIEGVEESLRGPDI